MKEVVAIIRANMINRTKKALLDAGFPSFTGCKAMGRGRRSVDFQVIQALDDGGSLADSPDFLPTIGQGGRLIPKRYLNIIVPSERVDALVKVLMTVNKTGQPGDGKVFVLPVKDVLRVRTGESGDAALDEMAAV